MAGSLSLGAGHDFSPFLPENSSGFQNLYRVVGFLFPWGLTFLLLCPGDHLLPDLPLPAPGSGESSIFWKEDLICYSLALLAARFRCLPLTLVVVVVDLDCWAALRMQRQVPNWSLRSAKSCCELATWLISHLTSVAQERVRLQSRTSLICWWTLRSGWT